VTTGWSRREFAALAAGTVAAPFAFVRSSAAPITAQDVVDRIKKHVGVDWNAETVDTFKAGDPASAVTGVAVTSMATLSVLDRAVKGGSNLIITCEPTFYTRADRPTPPAGRGAGGAAAPAAVAEARPAAPPPRLDPVFAAKQDFIARHRLVVWRFSDHWRRRTPDPFAQGLADALGWSRFRSETDPSRVSVPATTLAALASYLKKRLDARGGIRIVGDERLTVQTVGLLPATTAIQAGLKMLPNVDVIIAGEVREWESVEYVRDHVSAGEKKALITIGRVLSEEPGMNLCARWLQGIVPEVRTNWIANGDPYWRPA
jgi:putative NIF3 family GTP cyclohydrolase 1 type 2